MALYLVAYDLNQAGQNYKCISKKLESLDTHWHFQQSVWLVRWHGNSLELAEALQDCLDSNDSLFVTKVTNDSAWYGFHADGSVWLGANI